MRRPVGDKVPASEVDLNDGPYSAIKVFYERNSNIQLNLPYFILPTVFLEVSPFPTASISHK